jgi:hypothetical protein
MTKVKMAQIIAQALFAKYELPPADNWKVKQLARMKKEHLESEFEKAKRILAQKVDPDGIYGKQIA